MTEPLIDAAFHGLMKRTVQVNNVSPEATIDEAAPLKDLEITQKQLTRHNAMIKEFTFPAGCRLLTGWQQNDPAALLRLRDIFDACIAGDYDADFSRPAPQGAVNIGGSLNLMTLTIMHDLYGHDSAEFYKADPERYVRTTLMSRRMMGMNK
ncbi:MAG: hypothetical protein ACC631_05725, partial [Halocynthiibacter sp.]